jgi:hypothetical protein
LENLPWGKFLEKFIREFSNNWYIRDSRLAEFTLKLMNPLESNMKFKLGKLWGKLGIKIEDKKKQLEIWKFREFEKNRQSTEILLVVTKPLETYDEAFERTIKVEQLMNDFRENLLFDEDVEYKTDIPEEEMCKRLEFKDLFDEFSPKYRTFHMDEMINTLRKYAGETEFDIIQTFLIG